MRRQEVNWNFIRLDCKSDLRHLFSAQHVSTHFSWRRMSRQTFASLSPIFPPTFSSQKRQTEFTWVWQINGIKDINHETLLLPIFFSYRWVSIRVPCADYTIDRTIMTTISRVTWIKEQFSLGRDDFVKKT